MVVAGLRSFLAQPGARAALRAWPELAWISGGQLIGAAGALIGVRLVTGLIVPAAYGEFALAMTAATLAFQVVLGPLLNSYERYYAPARERGRTDAYYRAVRRLTARASTVMLLIGLLAAGGLTVLGQGTWLSLAAAAIAFALLSGWESVLDVIQNAARQRRLVAAHQAVRQWFRPILAAGLLGSIASTSVVGMSAYALASLVVLCSQFWFFRRTLPQAPSISTSDDMLPVLESQMLAYATPFAIWGLFTWMQISSDRWALEAFRSSSEVGLYAIVFQVGAYPLTLVGATLTQVAAPIVFAHAGEGSNLERIRGAVGVCAALAVTVLCVTLLLAVVGLFVHQQLFALLVGTQYRTASFLFPLAVLSSGFFVVGQMLSLMPMALGRSQALLAPKIWTASLAVFLNIGGAYFFGPTGVLWAGLIFAIWYCVWIALAARAAFLARCQSIRLATSASGTL